MKASVTIKVPGNVTHTQVKLDKTYSKVLNGDKRFVSQQGEIQFDALYDGTGSDVLDLRTEYSEGYTFLGTIVRGGKTIKVYGSLV